MKTKTSQRLFLAGITALFILSLTVAGHAAEYVSVKKDAVNIRSGPSTKHKILWEVFQNFPLKVLKQEGKWIYVEDYEEDRGWIYETLVTDKKMVIIKVDTANMRSGPGTDNPVVATVKKGVVFEPLEMNDDWVKLRYKDEITGWMHNSLLWPKKPL
jgi:SH3-like domain-containing protein